MVLWMVSSRCWPWFSQRKTRFNDFVECHTGDDMVAVCGDKIRKWRQLSGDLEVVDLKSAYLQIRVSRDLWKYQVVKYEGCIMP